MIKTKLLHKILDAVNALYNQYPSDNRGLQYNEYFHPISLKVFFIYDQKSGTYSPIWQHWISRFDTRYPNHFQHRHTRDILRQLV